MPTALSIVGDPKEYRGAPVDQRLLNVIRGGISRADQKYFMLRAPQSQAEQFKFVFFNEDGKGFYEPMRLTTDSTAEIAAFVIGRTAGGGAASTTKETLRIKVTPISGRAAPTLKISLNSTTRLGTLFIPARQEHWEANMEFTATTVSDPTIAAGGNPRRYDSQMKQASNRNAA